MTDTQAVLEKLLEDHVGRDNAITQAKLSDALGMNPSTLRSELRRLREERNLPIGNLRDGYFVIADREELQQYVAHINQEIESKRRTIRHTTEAWDQRGDEIESGGGSDILEQTWACAKCDSPTPKSEVRRPQRGELEGETLCKSCFGRYLMERKT